MQVDTPLEGCGRRLVQPPPIHPGNHEIDSIDKRYCAPKVQLEEVVAGAAGVAPVAKEPVFPVHTVYDDTDRDVMPAMHDGLSFESRFESGNLWKAVRVGEFEYNLLLRPDIGSGVTLWFYFLVRKMARDVPYVFNVINLYKEKSLFNQGFRPLMWSEREYDQLDKGWFRAGEMIHYGENGTKRKNGSYHYTLSFTVSFPHTGDVAFLSLCFPFTFTDLQDHLACLERDEVISTHFTRSELCRTLAGNRCDLLEITAPPSPGNQIADRRVIVISGRVHPGESNASWVVKGLIDFLTGETHVAALLRATFVFVVVPMLNPDGVINGFYRSNLSGQDLNRQWCDPSKQTHPTIYHLKERMHNLENRLVIPPAVHSVILGLPCSVLRFREHEHRKYVIRPNREIVARAGQSA